MGTILRFCAGAMQMRQRALLPREQPMPQPPQHPSRAGRVLLALRPGDPLLGLLHPEFVLHVIGAQGLDRARATRRA